MIDNYIDFVSYIKNLNTKPRLLLHVCCAPCSSHCLMLLKEYFNITIYYSNDNIYPKSEYDLRLEEVYEFVNKISNDIKVISDGYNSNDFYTAIKGKEELGERSERCYECYKLRLDKTAKKAKELGFDYFTTVLSISPYKVEIWINEIGYKKSEEYGVKYLYSNFKKDNGYKHSIELSKEYGLYRQDYCGCVFSYNERRLNDERNIEKNKD